jgi:hypothetical protein
MLEEHCLHKILIFLESSHLLEGRHLRDAACSFRTEAAWESGGETGLEPICSEGGLVFISLPYSNANACLLTLH